MNCTACNALLAANAAFCSACGAPAALLHPVFAQAERAHVVLRAQYDAGELDGDGFKAAVKARVVDHDGRYWMIGAESGAWYAHDGARWERAEPPRAVQGRSTGPGRQAAESPSWPLSSPLPAAGTPRTLQERFDRLALVAAGGFALVAVSTLLPWEWMSLGSGSASTNSGWDADTDLAPPIAGLAAVGLALSLVAGLAGHRAPRIVLAVAALLAAGIIAVGAWYVFDETTPNQHTISDRAILYWGRSYGVYVLAAATLIAMTGTVLLVLRSRPAFPVQEQPQWPG